MDNQKTYKHGYEDGVLAFYNYILFATANHWHANKEVNDICNIENRYAEETAENAFMWLAPEKFDEFEKMLEEARLKREKTSE